MNIVLWPHDTIASRFAWTVLLAVAVALVLVRLFLIFGGVWAREPLDRTVLPQRARDLVRLIEAAPPQLRPTLAAAGSTDGLTVDWYEATSPVSLMLWSDRGFDGQETARRHLLGDLQRTSVIFDPDGELRPPPPIAAAQPHPASAYFLSVQLRDRSWLVFSLPGRAWGLSFTQRWTVWLTFAALSIATVCTIATRRLVQPIKKFADAVRRFGVNPHAPALPERGPQEFREMTRAFNTMQAQIQKFVAYRTMMLAAISHDLRTPLTRIRLRGELIEDEIQQSRHFRDVDEMQTMVDGALAFFRGDMDEEATTTFDLAALLQTIVND